MSALNQEQIDQLVADFRKALEDSNATIHVEHFYFRGQVSGKRIVIETGFGSDSVVRTRNAGALA
jgi:hypothetical protein